MTTPLDLHGVIPPVVTPLTPDRELDVPSFQRVLTRMLDAGVDGVFVLGSTSEVAFATDAVRRRVVTEAARVVAGRVPLLAGVVDMATERVLDHARVAADLGADGVVATAPFYAVTPREQVRRHFEVLGERSPVPVVAYDIPVCVHTKLDADDLVALGRDGAIVAVKDSSGDDVGFRRLALLNRDAGEPLKLFTGHEVVVDGAYLSGAHGVVPGLGNVDPAGYVRLHRALQGGDWATARDEQDRLARLMDIVLAPRRTGGWGAGVGAFKAALVLLGVIDSHQLPLPFEGLDDADVDAVKAVLTEVGLAA